MARPTGLQAGHAHHRQPPLFPDTRTTGVRVDDPFELMQLSVQALREQAGGWPLMLAVADAQWRDRLAVEGRQCSPGGAGAADQL